MSTPNSCSSTKPKRQETEQPSSFGRRNSTTQKVSEVSESLKASTITQKVLEFIVLDVVVEDEGSVAYWDTYSQGTLFYHASTVYY